MPSLTHDAFLSYKREDEPVVRLLHDALVAAGFKVWWDRMLMPGQNWPDEIQRALDASRHALVCITPRAMQSDFIVAEVRRSAGKIVPVMLQPTQLSVLWDAAIGNLQHVDLSQAPHFATAPQFERLCAFLRGQPTPAGSPKAETLQARSEQLLTGAASGGVRQLALLLARSLLGGAPLDQIGAVAQDIEQRLRAHIDEPAPSIAALMVPLSGRLAAIGAESYQLVDPRTNVTFQCARFAEAGTGHAVLATAWANFHPVREPIISWANDWAAGQEHWIRMRLALSLGVLAKNPSLFASVWTSVLRPMLQENRSGRGRPGERFDVADAALSFAAIEPGLKSSIETILKDMIADGETESGSAARPVTAKPSLIPTAPLKVAPTPQAAAAPSAPPLATGQPVGQAVAKVPAPATPSVAAPTAAQPADVGGHLVTDLTGDASKATQLAIVARLACGYTGARYPDLAVKTLRKLVDNNRFGILRQVLGTSFKDRMIGGGAGNEGLWDPIGILVELLAWTDEVKRDDKPMPLSIFRWAVDDLPLAAGADGSTSLTSLLLSKRGVAALRRGFLLGLAERDTREDFELVLRQWRDQQRKSPATPDPVLALATALVSAAPTETDRDRVLFLFREHYTRPQMDALAKQVPVLAAGPEGELIRTS